MTSTPKGMLRCRTYGHDWTPSRAGSPVRLGKASVFAEECPHCGCVRTFDQNGLPSYRYPVGAVFGPEALHRVPQADARTPEQIAADLAEARARRDEIVAKFKRR